MSTADGGYLFSRFFNGRVVRPGDADYDERRELFNSRWDKKPELIALCRGTSDVSAAVRHAREHDLEIAVRCGGRHMAGFAGTNGGIVIDLSEMKGVMVDPHEQTAWIQGGLTGGVMHSSTSMYGLSGVTGMLSHVGVGGALLHGGVGYMSPVLGYGSDTLLAAEIVLADGTVRRVDDAADPELMWAMRGAGSNFGVVTWMKVRLAPSPRQTTSAYFYYTGDDAAEALRGLRDLDEQLGDDGMWYANMFQCPVDPSMPTELHGRPAMLVSLGHVGSEEKAERDIALMRSAGKIVAEHVEKKSITELNGADDDLYDRGRQWWDDVRIATLEDKAIDIFVESTYEMIDLGMTGFDYNSLYGLRGAMSRPSDLPSCFAREGSYSIGPMLFWDNPEDDAKHEAWSARTLQAYRDSGLAVDAAYFNCVQIPDSDRLRRSFGEESWQRLVRLKTELDPENVFHLNHNIKPDLR